MKKNRESSGKLYIVSTHIGNREDVTLRAIEILKLSDLVICEELKEGARLLKELNVNNKLETMNEHDEDQKIFQFIQMMQEGKKLALISDCGTPIFADPGYKLLKAALADDMDIIVVPGASSIMTAIVRSGMPLNQFLYAGFLQRTQDERQKQLFDLSKETRTVVLYETPYRLLPILEDATKIMPHRRAYIGMNLTMPYETHHYGTFTELYEKFKEERIKAEFVICFEGASQPEAARENIPQFDNDDSERDNRERRGRDGERSFGGDRERRGGGERSFGGDRERRGGGDRSFGGDRERRGGGDRSFGGDRERRGGGDRSFGGDRERRGGGDRSFGGDRERRGGGDRSFGGDRERRGGGDRKFGGGGDRKFGGGGGDRKFGGGGGDRKFGGGGGDRKFGGGGDRKFGGGGGDRKFGGGGGDRKFGGGGDRKFGGGGGDRKFGGGGGDRKFGGGGGDRKFGGGGGDRKFGGGGGDRKFGGGGGDRKFGGGGGDRKFGGGGGDRKFGGGGGDAPIRRRKENDNDE